MAFYCIVSVLLFSPTHHTIIVHVVVVESSQAPEMTVWDIIVVYRVVKGFLKCVLNWVKCLLLLSWIFFRCRLLA